jgi:DNA repair protein RecN (Recombination protein N)
MLAHLTIRDIILIESLDIEFSSGLSVLTGETGAGKSILLDALSLALGGRGDASLVRHGSSQGQVTAVFSVTPDHPARQLLSRNDISDDGDIVLRRVQMLDGRGKTYINDQVVSVAFLRDVGRLLVEIHGQHADRALVAVGAHLKLLDDFGGLTVDVLAVGCAFEAFKKAQNDLSSHRARIEIAAREADYLRASSDELNKLKPQKGEEEELALQRHGMMQIEKIATDISEADDVLSGHGSPVPNLASLFRRLDRKKDEAPELLAPIADALGLALDHLSHAQNAVELAMRASKFDPNVLERAEERLFALRAASRKFSVPVEKLPELALKMREDLAKLDAGSEKLLALEADVQVKLLAFDAVALELSDKRAIAAKDLDAAVMCELPALKLERAVFSTNIERSVENRSVSGIDNIEFFVQTNPGSRAGPIMKVASGGELSRFLLALKVALADKGSASTLVFDEIDSGVGGAVADAIGQRLKKLSSKVQVLTVTHAPQVAARSNTHFLISKAEMSGKMLTNIQIMDKNAQHEEIARMLSGEKITFEARAAALSLMSDIK